MDGKADVTGNVFDPNPAVAYSEKNNGALPLPNPINGKLPPLDIYRVLKTLRDIWVDNDVCKLGGTPPADDILPYIRMQTCTDPKNGSQVSPPTTGWNNSVFDFGVDNGTDIGGLDNVMVYYHADTILRYLDRVLGLGDTFDKPISGYAHVMDDSKDDSYYQNSGIYFPLVAWGDPPAYNFAKDADAILHECGHHVLEKHCTPNKPESKGIAEGFCDTLACVFFAPEHNEYKPWLFEEWIGKFPLCQGKRDLSSQIAYTQIGNFLDEYGISTIFSGALWELYNKIGGSNSDLTNRKISRASLITLAIRGITGLSSSNNPTIKDPMIPACTIPQFFIRMMCIDSALKNTQVKELDGQQLALPFGGRHLVDMLDVCKNNDPAGGFDRKIIDYNAGYDLSILPGAGPMYVNGNIWITDTNNVLTDVLEFNADPAQKKSYVFHAVVKNQGTADSGPFAVVFNLSRWAGLEFAYPQHYIRDANGNTAYISAAFIENLAAGASVEVTADLPGTSVPDPAVTTDFCFLACAYSPMDVTPLNATRNSVDTNNIAQRNLFIKNADAPQPAPQPAPQEENGTEVPPPPPPQEKKESVVTVSVLVSHQYHGAGDVQRIVVLRPNEWQDLKVEIVDNDGDAVEWLYRSIEKPIMRPPHRMPDGGVLSPKLPIAAGAGTFLEKIKPRFTVKGRKAILLTETGGKKSIVFNRGMQAGLPYIPAPKEAMTAQLKVTIPDRAKPGDIITLDVVTEDLQGKIIGGIRVEVRVT